jgi:hypothetical protein
MSSTRPLSSSLCPSLSLSHSLSLSFQTPHHFATSFSGICISTSTVGIWCCTWMEFSKLNSTLSRCIITRIIRWHKCFRCWKESRTATDCKDEFQETLLNRFRNEYDESYDGVNFISKRKYFLVGYVERWQRRSSGAENF